jgi:hypothetical protein
VETIIYIILEILFYLWGYLETMATIYLSVCLPVYLPIGLSRKTSAYTVLYKTVILRCAVVAARQLVMCMTSVVMICIASKITWGQKLHHRCKPR